MIELDWSLATQGLMGAHRLVGAVPGQQGLPRNRYVVAGVKLPVGGDGVSVLKLVPPFLDAVEQVVPPLGVHAQGGMDVEAGTLGLVDVVQPHGSGPPVLVWMFILPEAH